MTAHIYVYNSIDPLKYLKKVGVFLKFVCRIVWWWFFCHRESRFLNSYPCSSGMTKFACCIFVLILSVVGDKFCLIGSSISHNPSPLFCSQLRITSVFLYLQTKFFSATSLCLSEMTVHFSSKTCPKEMSDKRCECGNTVAVLAVTESLSDKGNTPFLEEPIVFASGRMTVHYFLPFFLWRLLYQRDWVLYIGTYHSDGLTHRASNNTSRYLFGVSSSFLFLAVSLSVEVVDSEEESLFLGFLTPL